MTSVEPLSSEFPYLLISVSGPFCAQQSLVWASPYPTQVAASLESSAQGALGGARSLHIPQYPRPTCSGLPPGSGRSLQKRGRWGVVSWTLLCSEPAPSPPVGP